VTEQFELAMVANFRLHEPHIVAYLEEMTSISFGWHLTGLITVALEPRLKIVDEFARIEIRHTSGLSPLKYEGLAHFQLLCL
jgi:hypothetical protein